MKKENENNIIVDKKYDIDNNQKASNEIRENDAENIIDVKEIESNKIREKNKKVDEKNLIENNQSESNEINKNEIINDNNKIKPNEIKEINKNSDDKNIEKIIKKMQMILIQI